jgi:hypothetical protein
MYIQTFIGTVAKRTRRPSLASCADDGNCLREEEMGLIDL